MTEIPMKASMLLMKGGEGKRIFGLMRLFGTDFGISDVSGNPFVTVDHYSLELVGVLRLFVFVFICICPPDSQN